MKKIHWNQNIISMLGSLLIERTTYYNIHFQFVEILGWSKNNGGF